MLAADELAPDRHGRAASHRLFRANWYKFNRNVWLDNTVEHTGKAFLGLTLNCVRCHDHRYDPIAQEEYYRIRAFFEPYQVRTDRVPGEADLMQDGLPRVYDGDASVPTYLFVRGNEATPDKDHPLSPGLPAMFAGAEMKIESVSLPPAAYYPASRSFVQEETLAAAQTAAEAARKTLAQSRQAVDAAQQQLAAMNSKPDSPAEPAAVQPFLSDNFAAARPELVADGRRRLGISRGQAVAEKNGRPAVPADFAGQSSAGLHGVVPPSDQRRPALEIGRTELRCNGRRFLPGRVPERRRKRLEAADLSRTARQAGLSARGRQTLADRIEPALSAQGRRSRRRGEHFRRRADAAGLPVAYSERRTGRLAVWAFDAEAEFLSIEAAPLAADIPLSEPADKPGPAVATQTVDGAKAAVEKATAAAQLAEKAAPRPKRTSTPSQRGSPLTRRSTPHRPPQIWQR